MKKMLLGLVVLTASWAVVSWFFSKSDAITSEEYSAQIPGGIFSLTQDSRRYLCSRGFSVPEEVRLNFKSNGTLELTNMPDCYGWRDTKDFRSGVAQWNLVRSKHILLDFKPPYEFGMKASYGGMQLVRAHSKLMLAVSVDGGKSGNYLFYEK